MWTIREYGSSFWGARIFYVCVGHWSPRLVKCVKSIVYDTDTFPNIFIHNKKWNKK